MTDYRIDCINKPDRSNQHERITHAGGPNPGGSGRWKEPVSNIVAWIDAKTHRFYVQDGNTVAWVGVNVSAAGNRFIQTHANNKWADNLLAQKEC